MENVKVFTGKSAAPKGMELKEIVIESERVTVTKIERKYFVPINIKDEELTEYLNSDIKLKEMISDSIDYSIDIESEIESKFYDKSTNFGGTLFDEIL